MTNRTTWILQEIAQSPSPSIVALEKAVLGAAYGVAKVHVVPFSDIMPAIPEDIEPPIVIYGMNTMIQNTHRHPKWRQGLFFDPTKFEPAEYAAILGEQMLNHDAVLTTCEELAESELGANDRFFLRPNDDSKAFAGRIMSFREYWRWYQECRDDPDPAYAELTAEMPVLYSDVKTILAEYRIFVLDRKIIAYSQYLPRLSEFVPAEVMEYAENIAQQYSPADAFVCDIARTPDGLKVIEFNCINGSGFYSANVDTIVRSLSIWQERQCEAV